MDLEQHFINGPPQAMYYIPNFITDGEEELILAKIPVKRWTSLAHRRLQAVPTQLTANNTLIASGLPDWLQRPIVQRIADLGFFDAAPHGINHCLINEYLPGQGIMPHEDGAAYYPVVATVSLGGSIVLEVVPKARAAEHGMPSATIDGSARDVTEGEGTWRILQEPRSLLVTTGSAYTETLHGIAELEEDRDLNAQSVANWDLLGDRESIETAGGRKSRTTRISLTFRDVRRVSSLGSKLLGKSRP